MHIFILAEERKLHVVVVYFNERALRLMVQVRAHYDQLSVPTCDWRPETIWVAIQLVTTDREIAEEKYQTKLLFKKEKRKLLCELPPEDRWKSRNNLKLTMHITSLLTLGLAALDGFGVGGVRHLYNVSILRIYPNIVAQFSD